MNTDHQIVTDSDLMANSYASVEELQDYASLRGITLSDHPPPSALLILAMDYLEGQYDHFKGVKERSEQPLQWPRREAWDSHGERIMGIPKRLKEAQMVLALEAQSRELQPSLSPKDTIVTRESVAEAVQFTYERVERGLTAPLFPKAAALLRPLCRERRITLRRT